MKKIVISFILLLFLSCANSPFSNKTTSLSGMSSGEQYIDLQVRIHTAYTLLKSLNAGVINQEEYEALKAEVLGN